VALYNEILVGRFNKFLAKMLSMKGQAPAPQLAGEITPAFNIFLGIENRALEGWYRYGILGIQAAVAAQASGVRIRNPATSNRLVIFEKIAVASFGPAVTSVTLETQTTAVDLAGIVAIASNSSWDKRLNVGSALVLSAAAPAAALSLGRSEVDLPGAGGSADFIIEEQQQIILSPGEAMQLRLGTVNQQLSATLWWRERFFEESEITV
jgi:hypothetical protein